MAPDHAISVNQRQVHCVYDSHTRFDHEPPCRERTRDVSPGFKGRSDDALVTRRHS